MNNFAVDLDQALNELERLESEEAELQKQEKIDKITEEEKELLNKEEENKEMPISEPIVQIESEINDSSEMKITNDDLENDLLINEEQNEINELAKSLIANVELIRKKNDNLSVEVNNLHEQINEENKNSNENGIKIQDDVYKIIETKGELNEELENSVELDPLIDYETTNILGLNSNGENISNLELIAKQLTTETPINTVELEDNSKTEPGLETVDDNISSLNEDSECFYDTVENPQVLSVDQLDEDKNQNKDGSEKKYENELESEDSQENATNEMVSNQPTTSSQAESYEEEEELNEPISTIIDIPRAPIEIIDFQTEWNQLTESEKTLGLIAPTWLPDSEAESCLKCSVKFSFRKRRHHCRACGLIFCSNCCSAKMPLPFKITKQPQASITNDENSENGSTNNKEVQRVCKICFETIHKVNNLRMHIQKLSTAAPIPIISVLKKKKSLSSLSSNPSESNLNISNINEFADVGDIHTTLIDPTSRPSDDMKPTGVRRTKSVRFSDGFMPGKLDDENCDINEPVINNDIDINSCSFEENKISDIDIDEIEAIEEIIDGLSPEFDEAKVIKEKLQSENFYGSVSFVLLRNLRVYVRIIDLSFCSMGKCWLFVTKGLCLNAQDELVYMLKCSVDEENNVNEMRIPRQILYHIMDIYDKSSKGYRISVMNHFLYDFESAKTASQILLTNMNQKSGLKLNKPAPNSSDSNNNENSNSEISTLLGNKENVGFLYYRPTSYHIQILNKFSQCLPDEPYLIGFILQKWEIPWAKLFPLRLYLRLGEQFDFYPCPFVSDPNRKSVYGEIGHTIMSLLCDTRNFQYTIAQIDGLSIHIDGQHTKISIPESQYDLIIKSLLTSNDYVFSMASLQMDDNCSSHLVAVENENLASYSSKTVSNAIQADSENQINNKITGAAFVVFNGALKTNLTINAKLSMIEDGIMIQIDTETMAKLKQNLQSMKPFKIECLKSIGQVSSNQSIPVDSVISVEWIKEDKHLNKCLHSIVDSRSMQGVKSLRLANTYDYVNDSKSIRWTEIYLIKIEDDSNSFDDNSFNLNRFADMCSQATCQALAPLLDDLVSVNARMLLEKRLKTSQKESPQASGSSSAASKSLKIKSFTPFRIGLRVEVNKDQVGYTLGMHGSQITNQKFLSNLDNELIQILHQANNFSLNISLEMIFYVQDRLLSQNQHHSSK